MSVKYPDITVKLSGVDGNAHAIMGAVVTALRKAGVPANRIERYKEESKAGDYDNVIQTAMRWVNVE